MTADFEDPRELHNLRLLEKHAPENLSSEYITQLLDTFSHQGSNGIHQCLVFEFLSPSVTKVLEYYSECAEQGGEGYLYPFTIL